MSSEEPTVVPDTPVEDLTLERVAEIFDDKQLVYRLENVETPDGDTGTILRTGFSNAAIAMQIRDNTLVIDSLWRGAFPTAQGPQVLMLTNQWNQENFAPTLRFFDSSAEELAVSAFRELHVGAGVSRNQLDAFVMTTIDAILGSFEWIEQKHPDLVTWESEHNHD